MTLKMPERWNILEGEKDRDGEYIIPPTTEEVVLLHGTSTRFLPDILKNGLQPRRITKKNVYSRLGYYDMQSNPDCCYFGDLAIARDGAMKAASVYSGLIMYVQAVLDVRHLVIEEDNRHYADDWRGSLARGSCACQMDSIRKL